MTWNGWKARSIRMTQKLSIRDLSALTGLNRGYLSRLERGEVRDPDAGKVKSVADGLQVDPKDLDPEWVNPDASEPREEQP